MGNRRYEKLLKKKTDLLKKERQAVENFSFDKNAGVARKNVANE